jgi:hypothetical protein
LFPLRFCPHACQVLDCAHGHQKENQEKVDKVEENCPREDNEDEEADTKGEDSKKILEEDGCEKICVK